jgi:hypothetical protein
MAKETIWTEIADACEKGEAREVLCVGDIISVTLKNGEKVRIAVAGIGTYKENEVVFTFKDILTKEHSMNVTDTNKGGYAESDMATYLDTEIFDLLPDDLQKVIKERRGHKLWLLSYREVFGESGAYAKKYNSPEDDVQLPYYKDIENREKERNGEHDNWWLASSYGRYRTNFGYVTSRGLADSYCASIPCGVAPNFCI